MSEDETEIREIAQQIADSSQHSSVKRGILDNTLGFLNSTPPVVLFDEGENIQFVFFNRKEGVEVDRESSGGYKPSESRGTLFIISDQRVLLLIGEENEDRGLSIPHGVIQGSSYKASLLGPHWLGFAGTSEITIETTEEEYTIPVIKASRNDVERASNHIEAYSQEKNGGAIEEFRPEINYDPREAGPEKEYKTILACRKCFEEVSRNVERCPHCGFAPQEDTRGATWKTGAAGLSMTILAPLGIAMGYDSMKKSHRAKKGVWIKKTIEVTELNNTNEDTKSSETQSDQGSNNIPGRNAGEKLRELNDLRSDGIITDSEFEQKKEEILSEY